MVTFVAVIALLVAELFVFVQAADALGFLPALALAVAVSLGGLWVVKRQGLGVVRRMAADSGERPASAEVADGAMILTAGLLLLFPGFITGACGLALLLPPVRALLRPVLTRRWKGSVRVVHATYRGPIVDATATDAADPDRKELGP